jgi:hypothetical protein
MHLAKLWVEQGNALLVATAAALLIGTAPIFAAIPTFS